MGMQSRVLGCYLPLCKRVQGELSEATVCAGAVLGQPLPAAALLGGA